jgi:hypothetical protein
MKATELRIGNYIDYTTEREIVTMQTTYEHIRLIHNGNKNFKPIPLTEEWLLKFGFEIDKDPETVFYEIRFDKIANYKFCFCISRKIGFGIFYYETNFSTTQIHSVHQLQNLYFAITNEELILVK